MDIGYDDFIRLCRVIPDMGAGVSEATRDKAIRDALDGGWAPWIKIQPDGAYFRPPEGERDDEAWSEQELAQLYDCPITDPDAPALPFPCTIEQLEDFLEQYGLYGCVDPFDLLQWQREQQSRSLDLNKQARQEQAILVALSGEGIHPQSAPKNPPGKPGIKSKIKQALVAEGNLFQSVGAFDKAWERLRSDGRLKDA
jgi:hypothetical protein